MFDIIIYLEGCNSVVFRNGEFGDEIAWAHDPLGFVHPEGPFFDP
jgi:hypothetical protein